MKTSKGIVLFKVWPATNYILVNLDEHIVYQFVSVACNKSEAK